MWGGGYKGGMYFGGDLLGELETKAVIAHLCITAIFAAEELTLTPLIEGSPNLAAAIAGSPSIAPVLDAAELHRDPLLEATITIHPGDS